MEDWLKCQISPLIRYRQNQQKKRVPKTIFYPPANNKVNSFLTDEPILM